MYINKKEASRECPNIGEQVNLVESITPGICGETDYPLRFNDSDGKGVYLPNETILKRRGWLYEQFFKVIIEKDVEVMFSSTFGIHEDGLRIEKCDPTGSYLFELDSYKGSFEVVSFPGSENFPKKESKGLSIIGLSHSKGWKKFVEIMFRDFASI